MKFPVFVRHCADVIFGSVSDHASGIPRGTSKTQTDALVREERRSQQMCHGVIQTARNLARFNVFILLVWKADSKVPPCCRATLDSKRLGNSAEWTRSFWTKCTSDGVDTQRTHRTTVDLHPEECKNTQLPVVCSSGGHHQWYFDSFWGWKTIEQSSFEKKYMKISETKVVHNQ